MCKRILIATAEARSAARAGPLSAAGPDSPAGMWGPRHPRAPQRQNSLPYPRRPRPRHGPSRSWIKRTMRPLRRGRDCRRPASNSGMARRLGGRGIWPPDSERQCDGHVVIRPRRRPGDREDDRRKGGLQHGVLRRAGNVNGRRPAPAHDALRWADEGTLTAAWPLASHVAASAAAPLARRNIHLDRDDDR